MSDFGQNDRLSMLPDEVQEYCEYLDSTEQSVSEFIQNQFVTDEKSPVSYARMISRLDPVDIEFHKNQFLSNLDQDIKPVAPKKSHVQTKLSNTILKHTFPPPLRETLLTKMQQRLPTPELETDADYDSDCNCPESRARFEEPVIGTKKPLDNVVENSPELNKFNHIDKNLLFSKSGPYRNLRESLSGAEKVLTPQTVIESAKVSASVDNPLKELAAALQGLLPTAPKKVTISLTYEL